MVEKAPEDENFWGGAEKEENKKRVFCDGRMVKRKYQG